jgi:hypothetical protein
MVTPSQFDPELGKVKGDEKSAKSIQPVIRPPLPSNYDRRSPTKFKSLLSKKSSDEDDDDEFAVNKDATDGTATGAATPFDVAQIHAKTQNKEAKTDTPIAGIDDSTKKQGTLLAMPDTTGGSTSNNIKNSANSDDSKAATPVQVPNVMPGPNIAVNPSDVQGIMQKTLDATTTLAPQRNELLEAIVGQETKKKAATAKDFTKDNIAPKSDAPSMVTNAPPPTPINQVQTVVEATNNTQSSQAAAQSRIESIQLIEKLVGSLVQQIKPDKTETTITLKDLPLFKDVTMVITEYNTSQKQFNITFYNLTDPLARSLIQNNQTALREALIEKGYTLQMVTIEPKIEPTATTLSEEAKENQSDQEEQGFGSGSGAGRSFDGEGVT